ncbi:hypothetical protein CR513_39283, partial [Mucuna pruriens]
MVFPFPHTVSEEASLLGENQTCQTQATSILTVRRRQDCPFVRTPSQATDRYRNQNNDILLDEDYDLQYFACCDYDYASCPLIRAKYQSMALRLVKLYGFRAFLSLVGFFQSCSMKLYFDIQVAMHIVVDIVFHEHNILRLSVILYLMNSWTTPSIITHYVIHTQLDEIKIFTNTLGIN